jgi:hypothetical protein
MLNSELIELNLGHIIAEWTKNDSELEGFIISNIKHPSENHYDIYYRNEYERPDPPTQTHTTASHRALDNVGSVAWIGSISNDKVYVYLGGTAEFNAYDPRFFEKLKKRLLYSISKDLSYWDPR